MQATPSFMKEDSLFPRYSPIKYTGQPRAVITENTGSTPKFSNPSELKVTRRTDDPVPQIEIPGWNDPLPNSSPPTPPPTCPTSGTVSVAITGITACGCGGVSGPTSFNITAMSGINAVHTLTWDAGFATFRLTGVGSITVESYTDAVCGSVDVTASGTFEITATCGSGLWSVEVSETSGPAVGIGSAFSTATPAPMGSAIPNSLTCAPNALIGGGTATVS